jgi:lipid-A-disaccharide synthase
VGHPLADEIIAPSDPLAARALLGIDASRVVAMLPGSRAGEVSRLAEPFARTASWLAARDPELRFVVPVASQKLAEQISVALEAYGPPGRWQLIDGQARETMAAADVVLLASGTASLEAMLLNRPMVVAYRISPLTYFLVRALRLIRVQFASLPNLLAGRRLVPELLQADARPELLGPAVEEWLKNPAQCDDLKKEFVKISALLKRNASAESARVVLQQIGTAR